MKLRAFSESLSERLEVAGKKEVLQRNREAAESLKAQCLRVSPGAL